MNWNYRVLRNEYDELVMIECYYDRGVLEGYSEGTAIIGDSLDDLRETLEQMSEAFEQPVLTLADVEGGNDRS